MDNHSSNRPHLRSKARSTPWKEKLRENCLKRVRHERSQLLWKIRSVSTSASASQTDKELCLKSIVTDEIRKFDRSSASRASPSVYGREVLFAEEQDMDILWQYEPQENSAADFAEYEELMLAMEQALYEDRKVEDEAREAAVLEEYEKTQAWEDEMVDAVLSSSQPRESQEHGVLCPICRRGLLRQQRQLIFCSCGLKLDMQNDKVGLDLLQAQLAEVWQEHANSCRASPQFVVENQFNISALYMQCQACGKFELVM